MSDTLDIQCPKCDQRMRVQRPKSPVQVTCPKCKQGIRLGGQVSKPGKPAVRPVTAKPATDPLTSVPASSPLPHRPLSSTRKESKSGTSVKTMVIVGAAAGALLLFAGIGFILWKTADSNSSVARNQAAPQFGGPGGPRRPRGTIEEEIASMNAQMESEMMEATQQHEARMQEINRKFESGELTNSTTKAKAGGAASTTPHQEMVGKFLTDANEVLAAMKSVKDDGTRKAATTQLRLLTTGLDDLVKEAEGLETLTVTQFIEVIGKYRDEIKKNSSELKDQFLRVKNSSHVSDQTFAKVMNKSAFAVDRTLRDFEYHWVNKATQKNSAQPKAVTVGANKETEKANWNSGAMMSAGELASASASTARVSRYRKQHPQESVVEMHFGPLLGRQLGTVQQSLAFKTKFLELVPDDEHGMVLAVYEGPLSEVIAIVEHWGQVDSVDAATRTIKVSLPKP